MQDIQWPIRALYPDFNTTLSGEITPIVVCPAEYLQYIPKFYERRGKEQVEGFTTILKNKMLKPEEIPKVKLHWGEISGLEGITMGEGDLSLFNMRGFAYYKTDTLKSYDALFASLISIFYIKKLLMIE